MIIYLLQLGIAKQSKQTLCAFSSVGRATDSKSVGLGFESLKAQLEKSGMD